jgi:hypothetical protein
MSATVLSFFRPAPTTAGDWSQQELAEFYRVEAASLQAGLRLSLDRGVTDEGDPWLVFCREDGEVFLHFARIDGSYVIVSDMVGEPLVGPDFRALLAELVTRNPSVLPINRLGPGAPGARSGAQILMHPAALLAAIVATTCLLSSMNEAVASEMKSTPLLKAPPGEDPEPHHGLAPLAAFDERHAIDDDAARSRGNEQRALAASTSVVLACIASVLDQSTAHHPQPMQIKLTQIESLASSTPSSSTVARIASDEGRLPDHAQETGRWAEARPGSQLSNSFTAPVHQTSSPQDAAIMLSAPNAGIVAPGLDGVPFFAKAGVNGVPSSSQTLWPSFEVVRPTAPHARDASAAATKGGASPTPTTAAPAESGTGQDGGPPQNSAGDVGQPREAARPAPTSEKSLIASTGPSQGNGATGVTGSAVSALGMSVAESSTKAPPTGSPDLGTSTTAAPMKSAAMVLSLDASPVTATQIVSEVAKSQGVLSPLQSLASLSTKTVSLFLHSIVGDTSFVAAVEGTTGSSNSKELLTSGGATAATGNAIGETKFGLDMTAPDPVTVTATAVTSGVAKATVVTPATMVAPGTVATPAVTVSSDHTMAGASSGQSTSTAQPHADSSQVVPVTDPGSLPAASSTSVGQAGAAASLQGAQAAAADSGHTSPTPSAASSAAMPAGPSAAKSGTTVAAAAGTASGGTTIPDGKGSGSVTSQGEGAPGDVDHSAALYTVAALLGSSNTTSKAVSISLVTNSTSLDAAQLRIIDAFMNSTPNVKIVATGNTLEIYDPSALNTPSVHAMSWDLGGGSTIKVVGLADGHVTG